MAETASVTTLDGHGFPIDSTVGYSRGPILDSSLAEARRRLYALELIRKRTATLGPDSFYNITGLHRDFPLAPDNLTWGEEWTGPAFYQDELDELAREHFGGRADDRTAVFNRCSAGIVATGLALVKPGTRAVSLVPGTRSHPSIGRGIRLAGGEPVQVNTIDRLDRLLDHGGVSLVVITGVSSELEVINPEILLKAAENARRAGVPTLLDDAYGTRLRPIIYGGPKSLKTGVDLAVTACDKAGMAGPRAGLMVGRAELMDLVASKAAELGLEARSPLAAAVHGSLAGFTPDHLQVEVAFGVRIQDALIDLYGAERVIRSGMGASLPAEKVYDIVREKMAVGDDSFDSGQALPVAPGEVTAAVGMYWLAEHGIISVSALGQPGASIWLRFKPDPGEVARMGGLSALVSAIDQGLNHVADRARSVADMKKLILGD